MSLAPTLITVLTISAGVGSASIGGSQPGYPLSTVTPSPADLSIPSRIPGVIQSVGPYSAPDPAAASIAGQVPFLWRERVVYPALPDGIPEEQDTAPTILWGDYTVPSVGAIGIAGKVPALRLDGGDQAFPDRFVATVSGLYPTVVIPEYQIPLKEPRAAGIEWRGLEPTMLCELLLEPADAQAEVATINGFAPELALRYGWQTVALSGAAVWTDVPTVP